MYTICLLVGLTTLAAAAPALAEGIETAAPIQAVVQDFGDRPVLAYYTRGSGSCDMVLMTNQEPGPRVRVSLMPAQAATIEDVSGGMLKLTCGEGAAQMLVERVPTSVTAASAPVATAVAP